MKTLKFALIAAIVACTMVSLAKADGFTGKPQFKKVVNLTLNQAIRTPGLVQAMFAQVSKEEILENHQHIYVATVQYNGATYRITGTLDQWMKFFIKKGVPPANTKGLSKN